MKMLLLIVALSISSQATCNKYTFTSALKMQCQANELRKKEIQAIENQTSVLKQILKEMKKT